MEMKKIAILVITAAVSLTACILDISGPESGSPTIDIARNQETESVKTQAFRETVDTAVAATVSAMPTFTPIPTDTPAPAITRTPTQGETPITGPTRVPPADRFEIPVDGQPFFGPENAPIMIVEFSDFNCGYCRKWHLETFQPLLDTYPEQIRFVYRDFPILSDESLNAAVAAQCAYEQGAFWGFQDALFTRSEPKGFETYLLFAQELGLNTQDFQDCFYGEGAEEEVLRDAQFASNIGVNGTPTFFINGIPLVGAQPIANFMTIIDQELGQ
jgi:protein-disulfide isomerase